MINHTASSVLNQISVQLAMLVRRSSELIRRWVEEVHEANESELILPALWLNQDLAYKEKHWHEACFLCTQCSISLVDKNFGSKSDKLYCSNCYDIQFSTKCEGCGDIFRSGSKKVEYKGQVFHDQCFLCVSCKTPIGSKSFVPKTFHLFHPVQV